MLGISDVIKNHLSVFKEKLNTSIPAEVVEITNTHPLTVTVKTSIAPKRQDGGYPQTIEIYGVPVIQPSGGGAAITFPVRKGDTLLLCFCMREIGEWLEGDGNPRVALTMGTHQITDAVALCGLYPNKHEDIPKTYDDRIYISYGESKLEIYENKIVISSGTIEVGKEGEEERLILGESFQTLFSNHTHIMDGKSSGAAPVFGFTGKPLPLPPVGGVSIKPNPDEGGELWWYDITNTPLAPAVAGEITLPLT